jgi:peptidoglycan/LPS O-acetylase OafA/YrhL
MTKTKNLKVRRYDLDWLRVIAILLVLLFHVGMFFVHWDWHVKNNITSRTFGYVMVWLHYWRMPLLLFISGAGTIFASAKRSKKEFTLERSKRLLIPLIFAMLVIVPPQIYFERIKNFVSYFDFYPTVFEFVPYPTGGSFSWHHMWFVLYLFIFSLIAIPLISFLKSDRSVSFITNLENYLSKKWAFLSYIIVIVLSQFILRPYFPDETHSLIDDWAYFTFCFTFFIAGMMVASSDKLWELLLQKRRFHLYFALISLALMQFLYAVDWDAIQPYLNIDLEQIWKINATITAWSWVIAIVGYGQKYLNKNSKILKFFNEGIYPFYILHQTVIIAIAYPMIDWSEGIIVKFLLLALLSFSVTVAIYALLIRPFNIMRFLFGMKPKQKSEQRLPVTAVKYAVQKEEL